MHNHDLKSHMAICTYLIGLYNHELVTCARAKSFTVGMRQVGVWLAGLPYTCLLASTFSNLPPACVLLYTSEMSEANGGKLSYKVGKLRYNSVGWFQIGIGNE